MSEVEKFYEWLQKCGNIYLHDNEKVIRSFDRILKHKIENIKVNLN